MLSGDKIKTLRTNARLTQQGLADKVGVSRTAISQWESGAYLPERENLISLGEALGVSVSVLLEEDSTPSSHPSFTAHQERNSPQPRISQATLDLEEIIKDLVYEHPDLAIGFRDTRENWKTLPDEDKQSIADALLSVFRPDPLRPTRLREKGRKGQV